jgi:RNA polymerase sigma factor (sigma-70 family)
MVKVREPQPAAKDDPSGDSASFAELYESFAPTVARAVVAVTGSPAVAEDITAEAFAKAWERWEAGLGDSPTAKGWIWTVAMNLAKRRFRRRREVPLDRTAEDPFDDHVRDLDLWRAVADLPRRQRQVVALRYVAGLAEHEIGEVLGVSTGAASASLAQARRQLRHTLEEAR